MPWKLGMGSSEDRAVNLTCRSGRRRYRDVTLENSAAWCSWGAAGPQVEHGSGPGSIAEASAGSLLSSGKGKYFTTEAHLSP